MSPGPDEGNGDDTDDRGSDTRNTDEVTDTSRTDGGPNGERESPSDDEVVEAAAAAAEELVFARLHRSDVEDYDVTVTFEEGILEVDVYVEAPDADADAEKVADDAALAASGAVDDLFDDAGE